MTEPNGRSSSNGTLLGMGAPEADVTDRIPIVPTPADPGVAEGFHTIESGRPNTTPTKLGMPEIGAAPDTPEPRNNVAATPLAVSKRSAPRLLAKEFTIPSGWFRAPQRAKPADDGVDGAGADDADSSTQASAVARPRTVSLGTVLLILVAATLVSAVALMLSRRDARDSRPEPQKSEDSQPTTLSPVATPPTVIAPAVVSADTSKPSSATAMPIAEPTAERPASVASVRRNATTPVRPGTRNTETPTPTAPTPTAGGASTALPAGSAFTTKRPF